MRPTETITVDTPHIQCDGGVGPLGHPRVALNLEAHGRAVCPYCARHFVLSEGARTASHGH